jgi:hypothetical protein
VDELRALCIKFGWYTEGTNAEYDHMLSLVENKAGGLVNLTTDKLGEIAADILAHNDNAAGDWDVLGIMYELGAACTTHFFRNHAI